MSGYIPESLRVLTVVRREDGTLSNALAFPPKQPTTPFKGAKIAPAELCGSDKVPGNRVTVEQLQSQLVAMNRVFFTLQDIGRIVGFNVAGSSCGSKRFRGYLGGLLRAGRIMKGYTGRKLDPTVIIDDVSAFEEIE